MSIINNLTIRQEIINDYRAVEELTREAFWDSYNPGCDEHLMVHKLRKSSAYIPELDLVVCDKEKIVGHILYTRSYVVDATNQRHEFISFGPISVLPSYQKQGVGTTLIERSKEIAKSMGFKAIFIYGNDAYYHRFGFLNAEVFGISTPDGKNFEAFMGLELIENALHGVTGRLYEDSAFEIGEEELQAFEKTFPYKEKRH